MWMLLGQVENRLLWKLEFPQLQKYKNKQTNKHTKKKIGVWQTNMYQFYEKDSLLSKS